MYDIVPNSWFHYIFSPQFRIKNIITEPSYGTQKIDEMSAPFPNRNWPDSHHFHPLLLHAQSELTYNTSNLSGLHMTSYHKQNLPS
jgi:hypothetical protein